MNDNNLMNGIINFLFIVMMALTFNPIKAIGNCHKAIKAVDDYHHCHTHNTDKTEQKQEQNKDHRDCEMACCHISLIEISFVKIILHASQNIFSSYPIYISRNLSGYRDDILRPPIC